MYFIPIKSTKSRAIARLLLSMAFAGLVCGVSAMGAPISRRSIAIPVSPPYHGVAMASTGAGDLFIFSGPSPALFIWNAEADSFGEFKIEVGLEVATADIASNGGLDVLVSSGSSNEIIRFGRRAESLGSIALPKDIDISPAAIAAGEDGRLFILNRRDGDIWLIGRDGRASRLLSPRSRSWVTEGKVDMSVAPDGRTLGLLSQAGLEIYQTQGRFIAELAVAVASPMAITLDDSGVWIAGEGVQYLPMKRGAKGMVVSSEELASWGIKGLRAIALLKDQIALLTIEGDRLLFFDRPVMDAGSK